MEANEPQKVEMEAQIKAQIDKWGEKIEELRAKADQSDDPNVKTLGHTKIKEMQAKREEALNQMTELKKASGESWFDMKKKIDGMVGDLDESYREAIAYYK